MKTAFRSLSFICIFLTLSACNKTESTGDPFNSQSQQIASSSGLVVVSSANPTSGNTDLDFVAGKAIDVGANTTRVRLLKDLPPYQYELVVYFDKVSLQATQVSLSWIYNKTVLSNAYSTSPAGVAVDKARNRINFSNTLLNSGLPSTANLNGVFNFIY